jgi:hypothetical protein
MRCDNAGKQILDGVLHDGSLYEVSFGKSPNSTELLLESQMEE